MCGIAGMMSSTGLYVDDLDGMKTALRHRGPDDSGSWVDEAVGVALAHTRLAIIDVSASGHQPMSSASGRFVITFNGEIYNHQALRAELIAIGAAPSWRGHSDTETLVAGFDAWGVESTLQRCLGMFALAVWDRKSSSLTLARDRLGEKPLYYGFHGDTFFFGSELKALRASRSFNAEIDRNALRHFVRLGYTPSPLSIYGGVFKLPAGTTLVVKPGQRGPFAPKPYWSLLAFARERRELAPEQDDQALKQLEELLSNAISLQQISDVPLGAFLSGGLDSSLIVALMQAMATQPVHTMTLGFESPKHNEAHHARAVAKHLGTRHTEMMVTHADAKDVIPLLPTLYDEPFADPSQMPTFLVSRLARRDVTVALSGDGGDELFGGYNRYRWARRILGIPRPARDLLAKALFALSPSTWDRWYSRCSVVLPQALRIQAAGDRAHKLGAVLNASSQADIYRRLTSTWLDSEDVVIARSSRIEDVGPAWTDLADLDCDESRMMMIDLLTYLPDDILCKVDRAAMGVSLETRVPFLDRRVVEFAWGLPLRMKIRDGQSKWLVRQLLYRFVPKELMERPKMGFGVPIADWLRGPLRPWAEELLSEERLRKDGYFHAAPIRQKWKEHLTGTRNWQDRLWNIIMFQAWVGQWLKPRA